MLRIAFIKQLQVINRETKVLQNNNEICSLNFQLSLLIIYLSSSVNVYHNHINFDFI